MKLSNYHKANVMKMAMDIIDEDIQKDESYKWDRRLHAEAMDAWKSIEKFHTRFTLRFLNEEEQIGCADLFLKCTLLTERILK